LVITRAVRVNLAGAKTFLISIRTTILRTSKFLVFSHGLLVISR
jgi:hypothetical protein